MLTTRKLIVEKPGKGIGSNWHSVKEVHPVIVRTAKISTLDFKDFAAVNSSFADVYDHGI